MPSSTTSTVPATLPKPAPEVRTGCGYVELVSIGSDDIGKIMFPGQAIKTTFGEVPIKATIPEDANGGTADYIIHFGTHELRGTVDTDCEAPVVDIGTPPTLPQPQTPIDVILPETR
jgi:hypothetical protein